MKIAITAKGESLTSQVDPRFGRALYIVLLDEASATVRVLDNSSNANAFKGAGIQAATMIADAGAELLITGYCGPKAFRTLEAAGIQVVSDAEGTVAEAVAAFKQGKLKITTAANAEAHW